MRRGAIALTEIPNLVVMPGRRITKPGGAVTGEGVGDYLHAAEIEERFSITLDNSELSGGLTVAELVQVVRKKLEG